MPPLWQHLLATRKSSMPLRHASALPFDCEEVAGDLCAPPGKHRLFLLVDTRRLAILERDQEGLYGSPVVGAGGGCTPRTGCSRHSRRTRSSYDESRSGLERARARAMFGSDAEEPTSGSHTPD